MPPPGAGERGRRAPGTVPDARRRMSAGSSAATRSHGAVSVLLVLSGAALFGTIGTAQVLGPAVPPPQLAAARLLLAAVLFVCVTGLAGRLRQVPWRHPPVWWAAVGQAAFNLSFLGAIAETGVAVGTLVAIGATPVLTGLVTRQVSRSWLGATLVAVAGLGLLTVGDAVGDPGAAGAGTGGVSALGVLLALGAAASYTTYILAGRGAATRGLPVGPYLTGAFLLAAVLTAPLLVVGDMGWVLAPGGALLVGYLAVVPTVVAYRLFNRGLGGVRPGTASTLGLAEPVVAALLAFGVLGERLGPVGLLGAALVLAGLVLVVRGTRTEGPV